MSMPQAIVLMGVAGTGKTSVGRHLSEILDWPFFDGDEFHSPENIAKMSQGIPLDDGDRIGWLVRLHDLIAHHLNDGISILVACSALKKEYRDRLREDISEMVFVYLKGDYDLILDRLQNRRNHYMEGGMLQSQFNDLEEPAEAIVINIDQGVDSIVDQILQNLDLDKDRSKYETES
jgi:gluconokinase